MQTDDRSATSPTALFTSNSRRSAGEIIATCVMWLAAACVTGMLLWILYDIFRRGAAHVNLAFLTSVPENAGRAGGIGPIVVSTLLILAVTLCVAGPLSLATAIALAEKRRTKSRFSRWVRQSLDVLAAVPSIVFGLFGNAFFCITLGMGYSILSGGLTLACMALPILIRTTEQAIAAVPDDYRYAAAGLGLSRTSTLFRIVLPVAAPGMAAGLVLGIGRALAETAALIFTAGYVTRMPESLHDSGRAMSVHIYDMAMNVPDGSSRAYGTACVLIVLLLIINATAVLLMRLAGLRLQPHTGGQP